MKNFNIISILFLLSILFSCQINKTLQPWKNDMSKRDYYWKENKDSIHLKIVGENLQPYFFKNKDSLQRDFSIKSFYFKTKEGRKLNAWLLKPKTDKPKASIFALHGNAGNINTHFQNFSDLTKFGYQIFLVDYSGFGFSEGKSTRKNALDDSFSAFEFFYNLDDVKNIAKIIYGQSMGGNFAIAVAGKNQEKIEGLVLEGTFMNFKNIANHYIPILGNFIIANNYDNKLNLKNFRKPILIVHSKQDRVVPFKLGRQIFENANERKLFFEINKCHICGIRFYSKEISEKIESLILKK